MEPISMSLMFAAGLGLQLFGGSQSRSGASAFNAAQIQQIQLEQQAEAKRKEAMELDARRKSVENVRQVQRAQSLGLATSVNQGAQFSSGMSGGQAQAAGQGNWNQAGIAQNLAIGESLFGINAQISQTRIAQANAGLQMQSGQAWSQLGGQLIGSAGTFGRLASGWGGERTPNTGSTSGMPSWMGSQTTMYGYQ